MKRKRNWWLLSLAIVSGGALTVFALVLVADQYGNQISLPDVELAAGLGGAIVGALMLI
jgi:hypothetical protein